MERMEKSIGSVCDRRLPTRIKKVYGSVVRPVMVYRLETVAVTKQVEEMEVAEVKIFLFYFYIDVPDSKESDGGNNTLSKQLLQPATGDACTLIEI